MLIDQYHNAAGNTVNISRQQASDFAKKIADDFNPLHNTDYSRFCVPGDLLFSLVLAKYGVTKHMRFTFSGMVTEDVTLVLPEPAEQLALCGQNEKEYLSIERLGDSSTDNLLIDNLTKRYVNFSGHTFPHVLVPLMEQHNVMINPDRPMVMYQSMLIDLNRLDKSNIELTLDQQKTVLEVVGKRGNVCLAFNLSADGEIIGRGEKHILLSGLRPFDRSIIDQVINDYAEWKTHFNR
ncbi:DUF3581 family protein [Oceanicoccus sp. KOV_DT_Chl]|uniref:DUF3581 family protein n=1 Tax=Oceanicoccus sp. KOV_DT_Chl TaxID=1904639 RepID=UPI00190EA99D|nr:DUF3581 family protein [Oceanicoccus sp. KOV_DT_Chl]